MKRGNGALARNQLKGIEMTKLSFSGESIWEPERSGNYNADCAAGRECAKELIAEMQRTGNPALLVHVVKCFAEMQGHEVGFMYQISLALIKPQTISSP